MSILQEADELINGPRAADYGDAKTEFLKVAHQWATYLWDKYGIHVPIEAEDICWMMADLKKIRQMVKKQLDNPRDAAGYIGLVEKVSAEPNAGIGGDPLPYWKNRTTQEAESLVNLAAGCDVTNQPDADDIYEHINSSPGGCDNAKCDLCYDRKSKNKKKKKPFERLVYPVYPTKK